MTITRQSGCKVNFLLNILGKRPDGFHELETVMHPVRLFDELTFERAGHAIQLTCTEPTLPTGPENLVYRAAAAYLERASLRDGLRIHLHKQLPLAAGLGGGSANAATTLLALNELFEHRLSQQDLHRLAASLGSDVPFFLQPCPAFATGRGERVTPLEPFPALQTAAFFLVHPGFGISTVWAYQTLARYPNALNGQPGKAQRLVELLRAGELASAGAQFYNSLEAPALHKYPLLALFQEFLREQGALTTLMSGSGSTTFAIFGDAALAEASADRFRAKFGDRNWLRIVSAGSVPP